MAKPLVVITDFLRDDLAPEREVLGDAARVVAFTASHEQELIGRIESAEAVILYHEISLSPQTIDRLRSCRLIVRGGVGFDNVDLECARKRGIPVANVPDYGSEEVADAALAMTLTLVRGITYLNARLRAGIGRWAPQEAAPLTRLRGAVFGIVGLGRIGTATALRAKAFGLDVCYFDPYKSDGYDKAIGIRRCDRLEELLATSLVISLHCPLSPETRHLISADSISRMRPGSYLVNTARGAIVDTSAVPPALASGQLAGVGLDVLPEEPPRSHDPLMTAWRDPQHQAYHRLIINPHAAFYSEQGMLDLRRKTAQACLRALTGQPLRNVVNNASV